MAECREAPDNDTSGIRNLEAATVGIEYDQTKQKHEQFSLSLFGLGFITRGFVQKLQLLPTGQVTLPAPKALESRIGDDALIDIADDEERVYEDLSTANGL